MLWLPDIKSFAYNKLFRKFLTYIFCRTTTPMIGGMPVQSLSNTYPPPPPNVLTQAPPPPPAPPIPPPPSTQIPVSGPRFSFHDINLYSVSTLQSHLTVKMEVSCFHLSFDMIFIIEVDFQPFFKDLLCDFILYTLSQWLKQSFISASSTASPAPA